MVFSTTYSERFYSLQIDSVLFAEFLMWKEHPSLDRSSAFLSRIYKEDIDPCLSFTRSEVRVCSCINSTCHICLFYSSILFCCPQLSKLVQRAVENNSLTIEPVAMSGLPTVKASSIECGVLKWVKRHTVYIKQLISVTIHCRTIAKSVVDIYRSHDLLVVIIFPTYSGFMAFHHLCFFFCFLT